MRNKIVYLFDYAKEHNLLPLNGRELYNLQDKAFQVPVDYEQTLDKELRTHFKLSLKQWVKRTKYMSEHYFPSLADEDREINRFIMRYAKERGGYSKARYVNYFYSLLNNAAKDKQIKRTKVNNRWLYDSI